MILDDKPLVPDFPQAPIDISIFQAIGIMGVLKAPQDVQGLMDHCRIDDPGGAGLGTFLDTIVIAEGRRRTA